MKLFFDLDGTLIDSRADIATGVNLTRADYGLPPLPQDEITHSVGNGMRKLMLRVMPDHADHIDELVVANKRHYREHLVEKTYAYPGVADALRRLHALGLKMAVCTNKASALVPEILNALGIGQYFTTITGGGDVEHLKPAPDLIELAAKRMGEPPSEDDWIIGDNYTDMAAGAALGLKVCQCAYGFGDPRDAKSTIIVNNLTEFADHIEAYMKS